MPVPIMAGAAPPGGVYLCIMIDRSVPPPIRDIAHLDFPAPDIRTMSGGIPLYLLPGPAEGLLKLEVIFLAGRVHERHPLQARGACRMLREGTLTRSSADIAEQTDCYGGAISSSDSMDHNGLILQCLTRFLPELLPVFADVLLHPAFPEKELQSFMRNNIQRLEEDLSKNEIVAYRELTALLFGDAHPYGYNTTPEMYRTLTREPLQSFWEAHFRAGNCLMLLSGEFDEEIIQAIDRRLCQPMRPGHSSQGYPLPEPDHRQVLHQQTRDSLQNAVRIGRRLFPRNHPDYYPMQAVNLLLGGYFGSRLMTQLREELGLTYNIYSNIDVMRHDGYFYISAEVSKEETARTLSEIYREVERLSEEEVSAEELLMMQRFAAGNMLHLLDGAFYRADTLRNLLVEGGDHEDFNRQVRAIRETDPGQVRLLARRWLRAADMSEVVVG